MKIQTTRIAVTDLAGKILLRISSGGGLVKDSIGGSFPLGDAGMGPPLPRAAIVGFCFGLVVFYKNTNFDQLTEFNTAKECSFLPELTHFWCFRTCVLTNKYRVVVF